MWKPRVHFASLDPLHDFATAAVCREYFYDSDGYFEDSEFPVVHPKFMEPSRWHVVLHGCLVWLCCLLCCCACFQWVTCYVGIFCCGGF